MGILDTTGIQPAVRKHIHSIAQALNGSFNLSVTPTTAGSSAAAVNAAIGGDGFSRTVLVELKSTDGDHCLWSDGLAMPVAVSLGSSAGTVSILEIGGTSGNATITNGYVALTLVYDGTWVAGEAMTFKAAPSNIVLAGKTLTTKTSVDSIIA